MMVLIIGYYLGKATNSNNISDNHTYTDTNYTKLPIYENQPYVIESKQSDDKIEELKSKLEEARDNAEQAKNSAEEVENHARMRFFETGSLEDQIQMMNAEDATTQANSALDNVEDAIQKTE